jgi:hypothetical protein
VARIKLVATGIVSAKALLADPTPTVEVMVLREMLFAKMMVFTKII